MEIGFMFLDACAIIYLLEGKDEKSDKIRQLVDEHLAIDGNCLFVSSLSILECLSFPKKQENNQLVIEYESFFAATNVAVIDISRDVIYSAVELRAKYALRTPDALQLACALQWRATFVTGDKNLFKVAELVVMIL